MNHTAARGIIIEAFTELTGRAPTRPEAQCVQGVAHLETGYGSGWRGAGVGSNNWGAIQCGSSWSGDRFSYTDTHPNDDGTSTTYRVDFRRYPSPVAGALDLVRVVYFARGRDQHVLVPAGIGDTMGVSRGLHATGYYEGFGATVEVRVRNHHAALCKGILEAARELDELWPNGSPLGQPTLRRGASGAAVKDWQRILGVVTDGFFGPMTEAATREWQKHHGLIPDGVVGPTTWEQARRTEDVDEEVTQPTPRAPTTVPGTIRRGSRGAVVQDWQRLLRIVADGLFGPVTETATRDWQAEKGLTADGIVGPLTWEAALADG